MRYVVEASYKPEAADILNKIAMAIGGCGHVVDRWMGPNMPGDAYDPIPDVVNCDWVVVWEGLTTDYEGYLSSAVNAGARVAYVGRGWMGEPDTFQIDTGGVGVLASWTHEFHAPDTESPGMVVRGGPVLVFIEDDTDVRMARFCPWFASNVDWLVHLDNNLGVDMTVRVPESLRRKDVMKVINDSPRMTLSDRPTLLDDLDCSAAMAVTTADEGLQAIAAGKPVLSYGHTAYRHNRVVAAVDGLQTQTRKRGSEIRDGFIPDVDAAACKSMVAAARYHTHHLGRIMAGLSMILPV